MKKYRFLSFAGLIFSICFYMATAYATEDIAPFGITMVDIPEGSFMMGSCGYTSKQQEENSRREFLGQEPIELDCTPDPHALEEEFPQREVRINAFQMANTPVTLGQFKEYLVASERTDRLTSRFMHYNKWGDNAPVVSVNWYDAHDFVDWLNTHHGGGWRLPSEAEWEYSARAGTTSRFYTGDCISNDQATFNGLNFSIEGCPRGKRSKGMVVVQSFAPNAFKLYGMAGNVFEWTQDCRNDDHHGAPSTEVARTDGDCNRRVLRGGAYQYGPADARSAARRGPWRPDPEGRGHARLHRSEITGFRVARSHPLESGTAELP